MATNFRGKIGAAVKKRQALPKWRSISAKYRKQIYATGRPPLDRSQAWHNLPYETKKLLDRKREEGLFGGQAGKAPYWYVQEAGEYKADIQATLYLTKSLEWWWQHVGYRWGQYIRRAALRK